MINNQIKHVWQRFAQSFRLMVGVPEYSAYVEHMRSAHPERAIMSQEEFFRERLEARYGSKGRLNRCC